MQSLPVRLIKFFYFDSVHFFKNLWKNSLRLVEEDLAIELMLQLLFVPLFHDSSYVGRVLSFIFRLSRVLIGLFAYVIVTIIILLIALIWYYSPILFFSQSLKFVPIAVISGGVLLFLLEVLIYPAKKIKQLSISSQLHLATKLNFQKLSWDKILASPSVKELIFRLEVPEEIFNNLTFQIDQPMLERIFELAKQTEADYLQESYFFVANLGLHPEINTALIKYQIQTADFHQALTFTQLRDNKHRLSFLWDDDFRVKHLKGLNRGWLAAPTPALDSVSVDLTAHAAYYSLDEFVGRQAPIEEIVQILSSANDKNALVVGPAGSGKSTLAQYLAKMIISGDAPASMATKRLVQLDLSRLLSGVQTEGDLAARVNAFFNEVRFFQNIIVFVDEIQNFGLGDLSNKLNLFGLIEPYLESGDIQFLATCDESSYERTIEQNSTLSRVFTKVDFPPATAIETQAYLQHHLITLERGGRLLITLRAIKEIVTLAQKHFHDRVLPDSAFIVLDQCLQLPTDKLPLIINSKSVQQVVAKHSKIPIISDNPDSNLELLTLGERLHQKFIDQEEAVQAITSTLKRAATSMREETRPIGSFLFIGPTGVGKTELAKLLAQEYFKGKGHFLRLDMSEYQIQSSLDRFLGNPTSPGLLTEEIAHNPYTLLLLDEFEKADPKILTLFLQILDDGRLTDFSGKTVDFTNTIIIATSNAASVSIAEGLKSGKTLQDIRPSIQYQLLQIFKPELLNRFDDIIMFKPLSPEDLDKVVAVKLTTLKTHLLDQGYIIDFSPELVAELARRGFDPTLGARPLRRLIQDTIEARLSNLILEQKLQKGQSFTLDRTIFD